MDTKIAIWYHIFIDDIRFRQVFHVLPSNLSHEIKLIVDRQDIHFF